MSKYLVGDSKLFWEDLFRNYTPRQIRENLFNATDEYDNEMLYQLLNYLSFENYQYIRKNIDNINFRFMNVDIRTLSDELTENQDFITLSNLIIYAHCMFPNNPAKGFKEIIDNLSKKLNIDGQIIIGYLYDIENEEDDREIYKQEIRDSVFIGPEYSYHYFRKIQDIKFECESGHDASFVYVKK